MRPLHFRHLTKTAGTSITSCLRSFYLDRLPFHKHCPVFLGDCQPWDLKIPNRPRDLLVFGTVRNPETHARSVHRQFFKDVPLNAFVRNHLWMLARPSEMLSDCEFIIQFENLAIDWQRFCEYADIEHQPLPHCRNQRHIPVSTDEFDSESLGIIRAHYQWVFDNFDYTG